MKFHLITALSLFSALLLLSACAQDAPSADRIKAARSVSIPLVNDFGGSPEVRIQWEQYADGLAVTAGETRLTIPADRPGRLRLPLAPAEGIYENHLLLKYLQPDGSEITRRSIELETPDRYRPVALTEYFDPLALLSAVRPFVRYASGRQDGQPGPDFDRAEEALVASEDHSTPSTEKYYSKSLFTFDNGLRLFFEMEYTIAPERIHVDYAVTPESGTDGVSAWGVSYRPRGLKGLRYVGLGAQDARVEPAFGLWTYDGSGAKAARSVLLDLWQGTMRIDGVGFVELDPARPEEVLLLGEAAGGPGQSLEADVPFRGSLDFSLK